jgi:hypothetical protein
MRGRIRLLRLGTPDAWADGERAVRCRTVCQVEATLVGDGIIERIPDPPSGPGRPRVGYRARAAWHAAAPAATESWPNSCSVTVRNKR